MWLEDIVLCVLDLRLLSLGSASMARPAG